MAKKIKLFDGIKVITSDEIVTVDGPLALWDLFGWDIKNDKNADECAMLVTRELLCFGRIDLTKMNGGKTLIVEIIPAKNTVVVKKGESE